MGGQRVFTGSCSACIALGFTLVTALGCNGLPSVTNPEGKCGVLWTEPGTRPSRIWLPTGERDAFTVAVHYVEVEHSASACGISASVTDPNTVDIATADSQPGDVVFGLTGVRSGGSTVRVSLGAAQPWWADVAVTDSQTLRHAIAHRGAGADAPENTLAAMRLAARYPVPGVEFDVRLTSDTIPILMHDATFARTTGYQGVVARTSFAASQTLNAVRYATRPLPPEPPPSLVATLHLLGATSIPLVLAEIKHEDEFPAAIEAERFLDAAQGSRLGDRLVVYSSNLDVLAALRGRDSTIRLGFIAPEWLPTQRAYLAEHRVQLMLYPLTVFTPANRAGLDQLRSDGVQLVAYTTSRLADVDSFVRAQPDVLVIADSVPALFAEPLATAQVRRASR